MAKLIQKLPALVATTREIATPKLVTFAKYARVRKEYEASEDNVLIINASRLSFLPPPRRRFLWQSLTCPKRLPTPRNSPSDHGRLVS